MRKNILSLFDLLQEFLIGAFRLFNSIAEPSLAILKTTSNPIHLFSVELNKMQAEIDGLEKTLSFFPNEKKLKMIRQFLDMKFNYPDSKAFAFFYFYSLKIKAQFPILLKIIYINL